MTNETGKGEPVVTTLLTWVALVIAIGGMLLSFEARRTPYKNFEDIGVVIEDFFGMAVTLVASAGGVLMAGIGLKNARDNAVPAPSLRPALVIHIVVFWSVFLLFLLMARH